jgi:hypothetical protein
MAEEYEAKAAALQAEMAARSPVDAAPPRAR